MKLGAEPKKAALLAGLVIVMVGVFYYEFFAGDSEPRHVAAPRVTAATPAAPQPAPVARGKSVQPVRRSASTRNASAEWKPTLGPKNPEDRPDPATIDPTLRLGLLAKVQGVDAGSPGRNLFAFGSAPPPPSAAKIVLPKVGKIAVNQPPATAPPPMPAGPAPPPQAPPMTFKYYGYKVSKTDGHKAAFLLDGDDILIAGENDTVKRRYRVVKIGLNSITIEDTQFKSTQTLPLQEQMAG